MSSGSPLPDLDDVLEQLERDRGRLTVTQAAVYYEASRSQPGLIDQVTPDGRRTPGRFENGEFIPA